MIRLLRKADSVARGRAAVPVARMHELVDDDVGFVAELMRSWPIDGWMDGWMVRAIAGAHAC